MPRDPRLYLEDIKRSVELVQAYTAGLDFEQFDCDQKTIDAVVRNLEIIGEAARPLPDDTKNLATDIEWRKITAMRNLLAHEYFGIDTVIVWDIVQNKLRSLKEFCGKTTWFRAQEVEVRRTKWITKAKELPSVPTTFTMVDRRSSKG